MDYAHSKASVVHNDDAIGVGHGKGRLDSDAAWETASTGAGKHWQMDLISESLVAGLRTKGRHGSDHWVTGYQVQVSNDEIAWTNVENRKTFIGNHNRDDLKDVIFATPVKARFVRVVPHSCYAACALRVGLLVCSGGLQSRFV